MFCLIVLHNYMYTFINGEELVFLKLEMYMYV